MIASQAGMVNNNCGGLESAGLASPCRARGLRERCVLPLDDPTIDLLVARRDDAVGGSPDAHRSMQTIAGSALKMSHQAQGAKRPVEEGGVRNCVGNPQISKRCEAGEGATDKIVPIDRYPPGAEAAIPVSGGSCGR